MNYTEYYLILIAPKMANPSITSAGINVMVNSFDMLCGIFYQILTYAKNRYCMNYFDLLFHESVLYTISGTNCLNGWAPPPYHFVKNS